MAALRDEMVKALNAWVNLPQRLSESPKQLTQAEAVAKIKQANRIWLFSRL